MKEHVVDGMKAVFAARVADFGCKRVMDQTATKERSGATHVMFFHSLP
jgi:hypothetical protein